MQANPLWPVENRFPKLDRDLRKDIVVVGGGMAGISTLFRLKEAGFDAALIERDQVGGPSTGASSGVLYYGSGTNLGPAIELFGKETAQALWAETRGSIREISSAAEKDHLDCGFRACGAIMAARTEDEVREIEEEYTAAKEIGLPVRLLSSSELTDYYPPSKFLAGIAFDEVCQVHPARFSANLAVKNDLEIYEETSADSWKDSDGGVEVKTPKGSIKGQRVIFTTNFEPLFGLENHFGIESSVILSSSPTKRVSEYFPSEKIIWTMDEKYDIIYPRGERLILEMYALGDEDKKIPYYYPGIEFNTEQQWGEVWAKPADWFPIVGPVADKIYAAIGMGDQGIIMSWLSAKKIPGILDGKRDWFSERTAPSRFVRSAGDSE